MTYEEFLNTPQRAETDCGRDCYGGYHVGMIQVSAENAADAERQAKLKDVEGGRDRLRNGSPDGDSFKESKEMAIALCEADELRGLYSQDAYNAAIESE